MKSKRKNPFLPIGLRITFLICAGFLFNYCHHGDIPVDESLLTKYNEMANPQTSAKSSEDIDCYLDYSCGMGEGMKETSSINQKLIDFLGGRKVIYFKVGASDNPPVIDLTTPEASFLNLDNYKEPGSKLKVAVDKITQNKNKVSIFITDFERVEDINKVATFAGAPEPHPIDVLAWAQTNFKDWLLSGNQIDVFAKKFSKPDYWFDKNHKAVYDNWIYTLVFTPNAVIKNEILYKKSVLNFLNGEYQNLDGANSKHFTYSANNFKVEQEKKDTITGDANDNITVQDLHVNTMNKGFEYYEFKTKELVNLNNDNSQNDKRIINKVKLSSQMPCFTDMQYGIKVYDITQSLTDFYNSLNQEAPEVKSNPETGKKDTIKNKPIKYAYQKEQPVEGVFDFVYNLDTKEIGIKLKPDFTGVSSNTIYQVDLVVKSAKVKGQSDADNVLKLNYANGYTINSLGESIKFAMNDVAANIENKVLYTFYIKLDK